MVGDPIDSLSWNEKTRRQVRAAVPPRARVHDAVDVGGRDPSHQQINGAALLVLDTGLLFVRTRVFGKPTTDHIAWAELRGYDLVPGQGMCVLETQRGQWLVMGGASFYEGKASQAERDARVEERFKQLFVAMDEARAV